MSQIYSNKKHIIVFSMQSLMDPLFQGLMYQYIRVHNEQYKGYVFHVFTEEHPEYSLSPLQVKDKQAALKTIGIIWYPLKYRKGAFLIGKKVLNICLLFWGILKVKRKYKVKRIIGSLVMASACCYVIAKLLRMQLFSFCFEPHSLYMKEFGIWSEKSAKYRILKTMEYRMAQSALHLTAPTIHTVDLLKSWNVKGKISRVPISVDTDKFSYSETQRQDIRKQYNIPSDRYVMLYLGKFRGIYYHENEVAAFFKQLLEFDPRIFIFTISPNDSDELTKAYLEAGLQQDDFLVLNKIPYDQIEGYISACDMGIVAIPPLDSQKYRTPVKIGNYLSCGIPFLLNRGIADDDIMAENENVGVVLESIHPKDVSKALPTLKSFMEEDPATLAPRCRAAAIKHRGIQNSVEVLHQMITDDY